VCGICGVVGMNDGRIAESLVRRMMSALVHRGPDEEGLAVAPSAVLGMRRLSIIDLPGGHQPVYNEDATISVVFNGEIYNFHELRRELESRGHIFRTHSDTEVIVHAYETWGEDCVRHLHGMFAFAILDAPPRPDAALSVFLARDRFGIKPLYYALAEGVFFFASEVRALLATNRVSPELSPAALESYILFGSVCEPMTLLECVCSLPPGHRLRIDSGSASQVCPEPYWQFSAPAPRPRSSSPKSLHAAARELRPVLEHAVRAHLISDVPLGIFLSSGVDSTALAALAARERAGVHALTIVFPEQEFSEAAIARRTAERLGARHRELLLSGEQLLDHLDHAAGALDQPTMDGINSYFVSWAARQAGLKVALSGLGGDEIFGGYSTFRAAPHTRRLAAVARHVPRSLRQVTAAGIARLGNRSGHGDARHKIAALWRDPHFLPHPYFYSRILFPPPHATALLRQPFAADSPWRAWLAAAVREAAPFDDFTAVSVLEARSYMVNTLLRDTDAVSMSHSLEVRVPFLDHPLVEFVAALPAAAKSAANRPKALLIETLSDLLPDEVVRQPKRTFTFPWESWLRSPLRDRVSSSLRELAPPLQPLLNSSAAIAVWEDFLAGRTSWSRPWSLFILNEWVRSHCSDAAAGTSLTAQSVAPIVEARPLT
jgi:asparagine synthase (glutamine-hydrolysing)